MRLTPILVLLVAATAAPAHASQVDDEVAEIRALYSGVGTAVDDACAGKPCLQAETTFMRMMPGTGPQQTHVRFYYAEHLPDEEMIYPTPYLQKAVVTHNIAAQEFYAEYLFAGVEPQLVFFFQADHVTERRVWLSDGRAIRIDVRPKGKPDEKQVRDAGITEAEVEHVRGIQARSIDLAALFATLVETADGAMGSWLYEDE